MSNPNTLSIDSMFLPGRRKTLNKLRARVKE